MAKKAKTRNKKYDPNKALRLEQRIEKRRRVEAEMPRYMYMRYDRDLLDLVTDNWLKLHPGNVPTELLAYYCEGELCIAINERLIDLIQKWEVTFYFDLENTETGEADAAELSFDLPPMHIRDILDQNSKVKIDRADGIKTRWQGIDKEIEDALKPLSDEGFICTKNVIEVRVFAGFKSVDAYERMESICQAIKLRRKFLDFSYLEYQENDQNESDNIQTEDAATA